MPSSLIYATVLTCEKVLCDIEDEVLSAIRMVDVYFVSPAAQGLDDGSFGVGLAILASARFSDPEPAEHTFQLQLERPNGEVKYLSAPYSHTTTRKYPDVFGGFNVRQQVAIAPTQFGLHWFHLLVDGEKVASVPFTLLPESARKTSAQQSGPDTSSGADLPA